MEFLASLAIKALVGTSICGVVSVGAVYKYDKTLLGFAKDDTQNTTKLVGGEKKEVEGETAKTQNEFEDNADLNTSAEGKTGSSETPGTPQSPEKTVEADAKVDGNSADENLSQPEGNTVTTIVKDVAIPITPIEKGGSSSGGSTDLVDPVETEGENGEDGVNTGDTVSGEKSKGVKAESVVLASVAGANGSGQTEPSAKK